MLSVSAVTYDAFAEHVPADWSFWRRNAETLAEDATCDTLAM